MITSLTHVLTLISNALLGPVILALLVLLAWTLLLTGGFLKEWLDRRGLRVALDRVLTDATRGAAAPALRDALGALGSGLPRRFTARMATHGVEAAAIAQTLADLEQDIADALARHTFITRVGPMLGLMGTLIPLGPALSGLANGDMGALASNLVVAFTATVVGLLISGVSYGLGLVRRAWYSRDLTDLEFIAARLTTAEVTR